MAEKKKEPEKPKVLALFIKSKSQHGFRRCGFGFKPEGCTIALSVLGEEKTKILKGDPDLIVEVTEIDGEPE